MKILFLNLPLFDDVLKYHQMVLKEHKIKKILACGLVGFKCEINSSGSKWVCSFCMKKARYFAELNNKEIKFLTFDKVIKIKNEDTSFRINAVNYLLSLYRTNGYNTKNRIRRYIDSLVSYSFVLETQIKNITKDKKVSCLLFFNSRFPSGQSAKKACEINDIDYLNYDLIAKKRIHLVKNGNVLDPVAFSKSIKNELKNIQTKEILQFSKKFMDYKLNNKFVAYPVHAKKQSLGLLPKGLQKKYISVFTSSEDEMQCYDLDFPYIDQFKEIQCLLDSLDKSIEIVIRVHPNQSGSNLENRLLLNLSEKGRKFFVIKGASKISTYSIMSNSMLNISFGSSTAIESVLLRIPAILIGRSIYDEFVSIVRFNSMSDFLNSYYWLNFEHKVSKLQIEQAAKWVSYVSGEFAKKNMVFNVKDKYSFHKNFLWKLMDKLVRLKRMLNHPFNFIFLKIIFYIKRESI